MALTANALFSATSGVFLLLAPAVAGRWLGVSADLVLRLIGVGLVGFAVFIGLVVHRRPIDVAAARLITAADIGWVAGSIALLLVRASWFTSSGVAIVAAVALAVAGFATAQALGLRIARGRLDGHPVR